MSFHEAACVKRFGISSTDFDWLCVHFCVQYSFQLHPLLCIYSKCSAFPRNCLVGSKKPDVRYVRKKNAAVYKHYNLSRHQLLNNNMFYEMYEFRIFISKVLIFYCQNLNAPLDITQRQEHLHHSSWKYLIQNNHFHRPNGFCLWLPAASKSETK